MAHIVVIDDDEQFRGMLAQMLNQDGHRVAVAGDGEEGLRLVNALKPDLIITDILMPHKDGIETIVALNRGGNTIPIIAISGGRRMITPEFNLESATMVGVSSTLAKPFAREALRKAIAGALASGAREGTT